jgi:hypothetical protein
MKKSKNLTRKNSVASLDGSPEKTTKLRKSQKETNRIFIEVDKNFLKQLMKKWDKRDEESKQKQEESNRKFEESNLRFNEMMRKIDESNKQIGGILNSNGEIAEAYFMNSFENNLYFAGQEYDEIDTNLRKKVKKLNLQAQFDIVMYNCSSVVIIEIKYNADKGDIPFVLKKPHTFKKLFPQYAHLDIYLGLAALHVDNDAEIEALKQGVAIIKQIGDNMVIYDEHLKTF